jgi:flagellum-specific ATP synthase
MIANPSFPNHRLGAALDRIKTARVTETRGRVVQLIGLVIESEGPVAAVGDVCHIVARDGTETLAEVVGFRNHHLLLMPLGEIHGIHPGCEVVATGGPLRVAVSDALKGRVIDALGQPLDGLPAVQSREMVKLNVAPPHPLQRQRIKHTFRTGIKALDTFTPCGRGHTV